VIDFLFIAKCAIFPLCHDKNELPYDRDDNDACFEIVGDIMR